MTAGSKIAARVAAGIAKVGTRTGTGTLICALEKPASGGGEPTTPWDVETDPLGAATMYDLVVVDGHFRVRDASGTLIGQTVRTLTISATGAAPAKNDRIAVGVAKADVDADTIWHEIAEVRPLQPGGVVLLYEADLKG